MRVVVLEREMDEAYQRFLLHHETSLIYHSSAYRDFLQDVAGGEPEDLIALDERDEICGALPLFFKSGPQGTVCNSLPFFGSIGGIVGATPQARSALLVQYNRIIAGPKIATATIVENPLDRYDNDDIKRDMTDYRIGQITPLPGLENLEGSLMEMFHQKTRNMVRKAEKNDFVIEIDETAYDFLESIHRETISALGGIAKSSSFFEFVQKHFPAGQMRRLYVARHRGELVAALLMLYFNKTAEYFVPVTRSDFRHFQPLSLIIYLLLSTRRGTVFGSGIGAGPGKARKGSTTSRSAGERRTANTPTTRGSGTGSCSSRPVKRYCGTIRCISSCHLLRCIRSPFMTAVSSMQATRWIEAMAAGSCIVAYDNAEQRIYDDARTARLVPEGDVDAAAQAIVELSQDPVPCQRLPRRRASSSVATLHAREYRERLVCSVRRSLSAGPQMIDNAQSATARGTIVVIGAAGFVGFTL